jgi:hypothetical protein
VNVLKRSVQLLFAWKFKTEYATFGFSDKANLGQGNM